MIPRLLRILATGVATWLLANFMRQQWLEYEPALALCAAAGGPWWCGLRTALYWGIGNRVFELLSVAAGAWALLARSPAAAYLALVLGVTGAVLYRFDLSALGILAGALVLVAPPRSAQYRPGQQQE